MTFYAVAHTGDIGDGEKLALQASGKDILLVKVSGDFYAVDGICSHALGYLDEGTLSDFTIHCPLHRGSFDVRTGAALTAPAKEPLHCYPLKIEGSEILIGIGKE
jgi:nitrite reductase/ring-hydroxylating ferredoxin subunit